MASMKPDNCIVRTFVVATERRDKNLYPHPSDFTYQLPVTLSNVIGVSIRDFKFGNETLINQNNKTIAIYGDAGAIDGTLIMTPGDYNNDITLLLAHVNSLFAPYGVQFSIDNATQKVQFAFTGSGVTDYLMIQYGPLLRILGYETGILIYRTTAPTLSVTGIQMYQSTATATRAYDTYNNKSEMVVRITDVEALLSNDSVTNRCTAILFNTTDSSGKTIRQCQDHFTPLLQTQARLQALRIKLLNMDGDLYDTINNEAILIIEFHCVQC